PLVDKYTFHRDAYIRGQEKYNEAQLRQDFTDPFFHALGWDVNNNKGHSEAYREVMHGEPIRIRGTTFFFDYTFRIGGIRKFIVETKKPSVRIKDDADSALQLRRYAWNAKLPLSILTNFEEFAIYDCTIKPEHGDNAAKGRIEYFAYNEIPAKWEYLVSVFSQDSILKGSFDKYAGSQKGRKGTATVDDDILTEIESWRDALAKNIAIRNPALSVDELNTVVQRTIDRLLFLRICEDRGIEEYTTLHKLLEGEQVYARLCKIFLEADAKYNSGLFHFEKEPDWNEMPDTLSLSLAIDDKVLKGIIKRLYYPETPYLFSVIPPEILGHVYEQFLGKVIRLTDGHQAKVEYKPEVKKAGGVFYTPQYIVEYIVKHTVGELTKDKTPRDVAKLRVLDPACGSGSFLIGAYQFLLDWHRDWYIENLVPVFIDKKSVADPAVLALLPEATPRGKKNIAQAELPIYKAGTSGDATRTRSDWRLTAVEKKRILLNNIYGVDIDQQAVEVTKLSLLLKVLEEENEENIDKQLKLFAERALPSLHQNIKCGNSLIGTDILTPEMPSEEVKRINPFDWEREFADVMKAGGFDAVIGNPPYVRMESLDRIFKDYAQKNYSSFSGRADLYVYFIEKAHKLLNKEGFFGIICASKFMRAKYGINLRDFIVKNYKLHEIIDFGELPVFQNASTFPAIFIAQNESVKEQNFVYTSIKRLDFSELSEEVKHIGKTKDNRSLDSVNWTLAEENEIDLIIKMNSKGKPLGEVINNQMFMGIKSGLTKAFEIDLKTRNKIIELNPEAAEIIKPFVNGKNIRRFHLDFDNIFLIYTHHGIDMKKYPAIIDHLNQFKEELKNRATKQEWYELQQPQYGLKQYLESPKILLPDIAKESRMTYDTQGHFVSNTVYFIPTNDLYLIGILNSKLIFNYFKRISTVIGDADNGGRLRWFRQDVERIPLRTINFTDPADKARHDRMIALVTQMLELNKKLQDATLDHEKTLLSRQVEAADAAIDALVYELYGLTEEEIKLVDPRE
ncbi:MAG: TaqI-like C-terminal specificity domain-containing protein, partial [Methanoregula sp.]|nr:TaqI-like C-terminal specificity domain-containing protein [Methanoregula sp.]